MQLEFLQELVDRIESRQPALEGWFRAHLSRVKFPLYSSVDLRNAGYKVSVVDTNIFPAGFNNICANDHVLASEKFRWALEDRIDPGGRVLIVPEIHTRNLFYLENVRVLAKLIAGAGYEVRVGTIDESFEDEAKEFADAGGQPILIERLARTGGRVRIERDGWEPSLIALNNDCSLGLPNLLQDIEQAILPSPLIGWHARRKMDHFKIAGRLLGEVGDLLGVDPWRLSAETHYVGEINFKEKDYQAAGLDRLEGVIDQTIAHVNQKYEASGITDTPYVFVKSNHGTYGMNIMTLYRGDELREINRKGRNKMAVGKSATQTHEVIVQEGVLTRDLLTDCVGEPVIYMVAGEIIGGFFRKHCMKDNRDNLNSSGAAFVTMCMSRDLGKPTQGEQRDPMEHQHLVGYGLLARVASLACGYELDVIEKAVEAAG